MRGEKVVGVLSLLFWGSMALLGGSADIFPIFPILFVSYSLMMYYMTNELSTDPKLAVLLIALSAGIYRFSMFHSTPSLVGMDPDAYAVQISRLLNGQSLSEISFIYYENAPLHLLYAVFIVRFFDFSIVQALGTFAFIVGMSLPLLSGSIAHVLSDAEIECSLLAAILMSVEVHSIKYSLLPIAQTTGTVLWSVSIFGLLLYVSQKRNRAAFLIFLTGVTAAMFTHSLPNIVLTFSILGVFVTAYITRLINEEGLPDLPTFATHQGPLALVVFALIAIQTVFLTDFAANLGWKVYGILVADLNIGSSISLSRTAAVAPVSTETQYIFRYGPSALLLFFAGVSWLYYAKKYLFSHNRAMSALLTVIAISTSLMMISIITPAVAQPVRFFFLLGPLFTALVGIFLVDTKRILMVSRTSSLHFVAMSAVHLLIAVLILTQPFASQSTPDYPNTPRMYLSDSELSAKHWAQESIEGPVYTDYYYAQEVMPSRFDDVARTDNYEQPYPRSPSDRKIKPMSSEITNGTITEKKHRRILFRDIETYRTPTGFWDLTWGYEEFLSREYHHIYDNGDPSIYFKR